MKKTIFYLLCFLFSAVVMAQPEKTVYLPANATLHFLSPEPIRYVDISTKSLAGDLPLKNLFRLKWRDSARTAADATLTIAGETFIAQYHVVPGKSGPQTIDILPEDMRPLDISGVSFSEPQLRTLSLRLFARKPDQKIGNARAFGLQGRLNHIYTAGNYLFLDLGYENKTNLPYSVDGLRFKIEDKKVIKAANNQSVELQPVFTLFAIPQFSKGYRNIFVFKKVSYPGNKRLTIELSEQPISGRILTLSIPYRDLLDADTISF